MRTLRFDPFSGIAGDMALAALLELGADLPFVQQQVAAVVGNEVGLSASRVVVQGIAATDLLVTLKAGAQPPHRHWPEIRQMLVDAPLEEAVRSASLATFQVLAEAEAEVHGVALDDVHFHEVGAWDSIADIVGVAAALVNLAVARVETLPVAIGTGFVQTEHGRLPVPAPATARLLVGLSVRQTAIATELTTPTGAALLKALALPLEVGGDWRVTATGFGAGKKVLAEQPNLLRASLGEVPDEPAQTLVMLETNIDDANPEWIGHALERALESGALDAWVTPIQMKKNRPGALVSLLCRPDQVAQFKALLFVETSAIGVRESRVARTALAREFVEVSLGSHVVRVKVARYGGKVVNVAPEHEDLKRVAAQTGDPVKQLHAAAVAAATSQFPSTSL